MGLSSKEDEKIEISRCVLVEYVFQMLVIGFKCNEKDDEACTFFFHSKERSLFIRMGID